MGHSQHMQGEVTNTLGARLKVARKRKRMTQESVAALMGLTHATVGQWEKDLTRPDVPHLIEAAELYDVSLDWLAWGGDVGSGIESRIRRIHKTLRPGLIERIHQEIDQTEEAAKRLPKEMLAEDVVKDRDERLRDWSAKGKKLTAPAGKDSPKPKGGGTQ